jgi:hypothetical protein
MSGPKLGFGNFGVFQQGDVYFLLLLFPDKWHEYTIYFLDYLKQVYPNMQRYRSKLIIALQLQHLKTVYVCQVSAICAAFVLFRQFFGWII